MFVCHNHFTQMSLSTSFRNDVIKIFFKDFVNKALNHIYCRHINYLKNNFKYPYIKPQKTNPLKEQTKFKSYKFFDQIVKSWLSNYIHRPRGKEGTIYIYIYIYIYIVCACVCVCARACVCVVLTSY